MDSNTIYIKTNSLYYYNICINIQYFESGFQLAWVLNNTLSKLLSQFNKLNKRPAKKRSKKTVTAAPTDTRSESKQFRNS